MSYSKERHREYMKERSKREDVKKRRKEYTRRHRENLRKEWIEFKSQFKCARCGYDEHPIGIDFHHPNGNDGFSEEKYNLMLRKSGIKKLMEETKKCIPLCAICHRIVHLEERKINRS